MGRIKRRINRFPRGGAHASDAPHLSSVRRSKHRVRIPSPPYLRNFVDVTAHIDGSLPPDGVPAWANLQTTDVLSSLGSLPLTTAEIPSRPEVVVMVAMVDDQYDIFVRNRSSSKDATSRSIIAAILLLLYPIMIGRAKGLPESSSLIQLPRSVDHKTKVVISVNEFGAKGNGFDDDTLVCMFLSKI